MIKVFLIYYIQSDLKIKINSTDCALSRDCIIFFCKDQVTGPIWNCHKTHIWDYGI